MLGKLLGNPAAAPAAVMITMITIVAAKSAPTPELVLAPCNPADSNQAWSYTDMAMLSHHDTGLVIVAGGTEVQHQPAAVELTANPLLTPAQWIRDEKTGQLHAFRQYGNRCLQVTDCGEVVEVADCKQGPEQSFSTPSHATQAPGLITSLCNGTKRCFTLGGARK